MASPGTVYAQVVVNIPSVQGVFDYALPPELGGKVNVGSLVRVPFGRRMVQGVVFRFIEQPAVAEVKAITGLIDPDPVLTSSQIALAEALKDTFWMSLADAVGLMLPPGLSQQADTLYALRTESASRADLDLSPVQKRLLNLLRRRGPLRGRQIDRHFKHVDWRRSAGKLVRMGLLTRQSVLPPPSVRPKYVRTAQLAVPPRVAEEAMPTLGKTPATLKRRQAALRMLMREADEVQVTWVYAESGCNLADLQTLAERGLIVLRENEAWRDPLARLAAETPLTESPTPTQAQERALEAIRSAFTHSPSRPLLLHGVTGSGKTEIYLRAVQEAIRRGRQAIVLVPEIALTPQTVRRFLARFPGQVGLLHSRLSAGERYDTWRRARAGMLNVVIGPRSALFAPLPDVGVIVADECHDGSYYQSEPPFYHAVEAAILYARLSGAVCLLGSATPPVTYRYRAERGEFHLLKLPKRIASSPPQEDARSLSLPPVHVVDMRAELVSGHRGIFSHALLDALAETLARGEQAILFLNRRGTATYVFCRECGYALKCPRCDTPLTYHIHPPKGSSPLLCHRCGYTRQMPGRCPQCGGTQIRQYGLGSERVEAEVQRLFPQARTLRWDRDTTRHKDAHEIILSHFVAHRADVLIGTQMLAKGLDLPLVTLVGIVLADVGLNFPDPFAAERVFQVLMQVAGRAGRSTRGGRVILQTFQPEHYAIRHAARHDYDGFYARELDYRRRLGYPPFARLVRLEYRHLQATQAEEAAHALAERLHRWLKEEDRRQTTVIGPVPCFFSPLGGLHRWQIVLRGPEPETLLRGRHIPEGWRVEIEPPSLL